MLSAEEMRAVGHALRQAAEESSAWPFQEARKIIARLAKRPKDIVLFETGYGPSGLPHIGTFGEVARTSMVRHAFRVLTNDNIATRLVCFSDDMDGLRKVPDNVPNRPMMEAYLGKPLSRIPDPFSNDHPSFGAANNARLRAFLDAFDFDYEFISATQTYEAGAFDTALLRLLAVYDQVMAIILPTLGEERRATYSPFLPISPTSGIVLQVPMLARDVTAGTITYADPDTGDLVTTRVTGGAVKCQWKADWALRWFALGVDYEMAGKDLIESVKLSSRICQVLGALPPDGFNYELFLDEEGRKISKSKGNGLTIEEWLRYASPQSLSLFMFRDPKAAKRLHFDVIPRNVDEYQQFLDGYQRQDLKQRLGNPVWHIHSGHPPTPQSPVNFGMLMNLAAASNAENPDVLWGFIGHYLPGVTAQTHPAFAREVGYAIRYYQDFILPTKRYRIPNLDERLALADLRTALASLETDAKADAIQSKIYDVGRRAPYTTEQKDGTLGVKLDWFNLLYQVLLGQEKGPRFGTFVAIYGIENTISLIDDTLARNT